jgi:uncharacterized membrane protein YbhN (UPF0104 family)
MVDYTQEELQKILKELRSYKLPLLTRIVKKVVYPFFKYSILPVFVILFILFVLYNHHHGYGYEWVWTLGKTVVLFYIIGVAGLSLLGHLCELYSVNRLRRRLGLTHQQFRTMVVTFQIDGF